MLTLDAAIESIEDVLDAQFVQDWYEEGIPSFESLHFKNGNLVPYICVQYGDLVQGYETAVAGTRGDAHDFPIRFIAVAPTAKIARQLRNRITDKFTGFEPEYCGQMTKRGGGGAFTVVDNNGAVVAYIAPAMFRASLTLFEVP